MNRQAFFVSIQTAGKAAAVELGRRGGSKDSKARAARMTPEERSEAARKAVNTRWAKKRREQSS